MKIRDKDIQSGLVKDETEWERVKKKTKSVLLAQTFSENLDVFSEVLVA